MREQQILSWLSQQQSAIDQVICEAAGQFLKNNQRKPNFKFDVIESQSEMYNLSGNKDLCYDRYSLPFVYSMWYHARRINTFIKFFARSILDSQDKLIEIFDLGAGTGAVQFSIGLVVQAMKEIGIEPPKIRVINIDTSPFMLAYNKDYLWPAFLSHYPNLTRGADFQVEYNVNSWNVKTEQQATNPWLTASYLFDVSDNRDAIAKDFVSIIEHFKPTTILLLTSNQPAKVTLLNGVLEEIRRNGYSVENFGETSLLFTGILDKVSNLRTRLNKEYPSKGMISNSTWNDKSFIGTVLRKRDLALNLVTAVSKIDLYNPKIRVRKDIKLTEKQLEASRFFGRPSVIIGPAGSGKSVVISEKIKYLVEAQEYNTNLKLLVTTFNKELIKKLGEWLEQLLKPSRFKKEMVSDEASLFYFDGSLKPNITLYHFDILPTRLGLVNVGITSDAVHLSLILRFANEVKNERGIKDNRYNNILNPEFLYEEYQRVFYGMNIRNRKEYLNDKRKGRGKIKLNQERRGLVYDCLEKYIKHIHKNQINSFTTVRRMFLNKLDINQINIKFDHIFIDEYQDCTDSDFRIFYSLVKDVNNLTFAGDLAQSIHIGKSADIPRDSQMARKQPFLLEGSYRLPQRISESIMPLSNLIVKRWKQNEGVEQIAPVKNSPPGSRPVVIYAPNNESLASKIKEVFETYQLYDLKQVTILEKDKDLSRKLDNLNIANETDSILRLKGLEKDCIVWSTTTKINDEKEVFEFVYTILTRTSTILIICLSDETLEIYKKVLGMLDRDKLIMWDEITKKRYASFCESVGELDMVEDDYDGVIWAF